MDRHVIHALLRLMLDHFEQALLGDVLGLLDLLDRLVDWDRADRHGTGGDDLSADRIDITAGGEVHDRIGAQIDGHLQLGEFVVDVRCDRRVADVRVDLATGLDADAHRLKALTQVFDIGRDDHASPGDLRADLLRRRSPHDGRRIPSRG